MLPVGLLTHRFILGLSSQISKNSVTVGFVCDYSGGAVPLNNDSLLFSVFPEQKYFSFYTGSTFDIQLFKALYR
jgi:hypothetical protein